MNKNQDRAENARSCFLYKENHSLYEWFNGAYGDDRNTPLDVWKLKEEAGGWMKEASLV